jgi:hypothetical protein
MYLRLGRDDGSSQGGKKMFICREVDQALIARCGVLKDLMSTSGLTRFSHVCEDDFMLFQRANATASKEDLVRLIQVYKPAVVQLSNIGCSSLRSLCLRAPCHFKHCERQTFYN